MTGKFKDGHIGQLTSLLVDGQEFGEKQIKELLKGIKAEKIVKSAKGKK